MYNISNTLHVKHFIIECKAFTFIRKHFFNVNDIKDMFENINIDEILYFLQETKSYHTK